MFGAHCDGLLCFLNNYLASMIFDPVKLKGGFRRKKFVHRMDARRRA